MTSQHIMDESGLPVGPVDGIETPAFDILQRMNQTPQTPERQYPATSPGTGLYEEVRQAMLGHATENSKAVIYANVLDAILAKYMPDSPRPVEASYSAVEVAKLDVQREIFESLNAGKVVTLFDQRIGFLDSLASVEASALPGDEGVTQELQDLFSPTGDIWSKPQNTVVRLVSAILARHREQATAPYREALTVCLDAIAAHRGDETYNPGNALDLAFKKGTEALAAHPTKAESQEVRA